MKNRVLWVVLLAVLFGQSAGVWHLRCERQTLVEREQQLTDDCNRLVEEIARTKDWALVCTPRDVDREADDFGNAFGVMHRAYRKNHFDLVGEPRSSKWPKVRSDHLQQHPTCEACGGKVYLQVHHVKPFKLFPALELDPENLITLCENPAHNCHLIFGHLGSFRDSCPTVREDAARHLQQIQDRPGTKAEVERFWLKYHRDDDSPRLQKPAETILNTVP